MRHVTLSPAVLAGALAAAVLCGGMRAALAAPAELGPGATIALKGAHGVPACISCHGMHGEGNAAAGFPRLAGVGEAYLLEQLDAFADGKRTNPTMQMFAKQLSSSERSSLAQYFSQLAAPAGLDLSDRADAAPNDTGAWLATRGRWSQGLPACVQCHGPGGAGVGTTFPPLAGQSAAYISAQLHAWKTGARAPGPLGLMPAVASKLSDADISAVANYYASNRHATNAAAPGSAQ